MALNRNVRTVVLSAFFLFALLFRVDAAEQEPEVGIKQMLENVRGKHKIPSLTIAVVRSEKIEAMELSLIHI